MHVGHQLDLTGYGDHSHIHLSIPQHEQEFSLDGDLFKRQLYLKMNQLDLSKYFTPLKNTIVSATATLAANQQQLQFNLLAEGQWLNQPLDMNINFTNNQKNEIQSQANVKIGKDNTLVWSILDSQIKFANIDFQALNKIYPFLDGQVFAELKPDLAQNASVADIKIPKFEIGRFILNQGEIRLILDPQWQIQLSADQLSYDQHQLKAIEAKFDIKTQQLHIETQYDANHVNANLVFESAGNVLLQAMRIGKKSNDLATQASEPNYYIAHDGKF